MCVCVFIYAFAEVCVSMCMCERGGGDSTPLRDLLLIESWYISFELPTEEAISMQRKVKFSSCIPPVQSQPWV